MTELEEKYKSIYVSYYFRLKHFAKEYVGIEEDAENIVQDVFLDLWEKPELYSYSLNLIAVLFTSVKNKCIDLLRHKIAGQKIEKHLQSEYERTMPLKLQSLEAFDNDIASQQDIEKLISDAINSLPEKCRIIFIKNKIEGQKQKDIAKEMNLSINTIESQMAIAYKKLKKELKDLLPLLVFLLG